MRKMNPRSLLKEYGNAFVLLMLCIFVSLVTIEKQSATSSSAAKELVNEVVNDLGADSNVSILLHKGKGAANFAKDLESALMAKVHPRDRCSRRQAHRRSKFLAFHRKLARSSDCD